MCTIRIKRPYSLKIMIVRKKQFYLHYFVAFYAKKCLSIYECLLGEMVDTTDLKSVGRIPVPVRVWQQAPFQKSFNLINIF